MLGILPQHCLLQMCTTVSHNNPPSQSLQTLHTSSHNPLIHFLHPHRLKMMPSKCSRKDLVKMICAMIIVRTSASWMEVEEGLLPTIAERAGMGFAFGNGDRCHLEGQRRMSLLRFFGARRLMLNPRSTTDQSRPIVTYSCPSHRSQSCVSRTLTGRHCAHCIVI